VHIVRMLAVHNEADILQRNIDWYAEAGFATAVIDNESNDGSHEICQAALDDGKIAALQRMQTEGFDRERLLAALLDLARRQRPDFLLLTDADEFFETADGSDLRTAMEDDFAGGCTVLSFCRMDFALTRDDDEGDPDPITRMRYYSRLSSRLHRAYPNVEGIDIASGMGHRPVFPAGVDEVVSPRVYISRHYPLRSPEQALRKLQRIKFDPRRPAQRHHYLHLSGKRKDLFVKPSELVRYDEDHVWDFSARVPETKFNQAAHALRRARLELFELQREHAELESRHARLRREHQELTDEIAARDAVGARDARR
jgi:hypothetical protein